MIVHVTANETHSFWSCRLGPGPLPYNSPVTVILVKQTVISELHRALMRAGTRRSSVQEPKAPALLSLGAGLLYDPVQTPSERSPRSGRDTHGWDAAGSGAADSRSHTRSRGPLEAVRSPPVPAYGERSTAAVADAHPRACLHAGNGLLKT